MYLIVKKKENVHFNPEERAKVRYKKAGNKINCYSFGATYMTL